MLLTSQQRLKRIHLKIAFSICINTETANNTLITPPISDSQRTMSTTMSSNGSPTQSAHILVFPYPAQGHIISLLDLTHQLSLRGLTITILVTPKNLPILTPLLSKNPQITTLVLPFPENQPNIPPGAENTKDLAPGSFQFMMQAIGELYNPLLNWFQSHPSPPIAIISDFFLGWTQKLASQLGIPRIVFSPSGAFGLAVVDSLFIDPPEFTDDLNSLIHFPKIPGSPVFKLYQLPGAFRDYKKGNLKFFGDGFLANAESWGIVFNTFTELESAYLNYFMKETRYHYQDRVWAAGPLLPAEDNNNEYVGGESADRGGSGSLVSTKDLLTWLDSAPDDSVVYVCFGSQVVLTNKQIEIVAAALECSRVRFIWSVKQPTKGHAEGEYGMVPGGFEDRMAGRGLVIKGWAPQVLILKHRSVGSFLTHCGWNSTIEAITAGVVPLAWPMRAEQFMNATLLVDKMKVAVRVCEGVDSVPDATELGRAMSESVNGNRAERERVKELRKAANDAVKEGGSSSKELDSLVKKLNGLILIKEARSIR